MKDIIHLICLVAIVAMAVLITRWMFNTVMAADIPNWLKYMILR